MEAPLPMVSSTTGAMNSLLHNKILQIDPSYGLLVGNLLALNGVFDQLCRRNDVFDKLGQWMVRDALVDEWMLQAREVTYEIEDWVDGLHLRVGFGCSDQVEEFVYEIRDMLDRCQRYNLIAKRKEEPSSEYAGLAYVAASKIIFSADATRRFYEEAPCLVDIVPHGEQREKIGDTNRRLLYWEAPHCIVVGIDEQREKIGEIVMDKEQQHRKVVSLVGTGGIGKTTLAKEIYRHLQGRFDCGAFVCLGRNPCVENTLIRILDQAYPSWQYKMDLQDLCCAPPWDEQKLTHILWALLKTKSYFVVLDDVRSIGDWKTISCALPNNGNGEVARVLITTRDKNVAESCCVHPSDVVHHMSCLAKDESNKLFDSKMPVIRHVFRLAKNDSKEISGLLHDDSDVMLEMCGGTPIAITVTAGLISLKGPCVLPIFQGIRMILELSYADLPLPVKSCFLYLAAFPENCTIKKDRLIWRWIAEGFIAPRDGKSLFETGESYFDELINRRLIQPAFDDGVNDQWIGCTVPGVVLDFVVSVSARENFVTTVAELNAQVFPCGWIRRLCLHVSDEDKADSWRRLHLSRVRSLSFSGSARRVPDVGALRLLRVLDLEDTKGLEYATLQSIGHLSLLRYLGLAGTDVIELPEQIMALEQLAILDLRRCRVGMILDFRNTQLMSVLGDGLVIRGGMVGMQKLEELSIVDFDASSAYDVTQLVNQSRGLRMLGVRFGRSRDLMEDYRWQVKQFLDEVGKSNLQSFLLINYLSGLLDLLVDSWDHKSKSHDLRKFELRIDAWLPLVPQTIASLVDLTHVHIKVATVDQDGLCALGSLPNLVLLDLHSHTGGRLTVSHSDSFPCLKVFWYHGHYSSICFEAEAMPQLQRLGLYLHVPMHMDLNFGIQNLCSLVHIRVIINSDDASTFLWVEDSIRAQVSENYNHPGFEVVKDTRFATDLQKLGDMYIWSPEQEC